MAPHHAQRTADAQAPILKRSPQMACKKCVVIGKDYHNIIVSLSLFFYISFASCFFNIKIFFIFYIIDLFLTKIYFSKYNNFPSPVLFRSFLLFDHTHTHTHIYIYIYIYIYEGLISI